MVIAALATAYTLFLIFAAGPDKLLLSCILYAPGAILYVMARREREPSAVPARRSRCCSAIIVLGAVAGVVVAGDRGHRDLSRPKGIDMTNPSAQLRRALRGRQAAQGAGVLAGPGPRTAHPDQLRRPAVRRRAVGAERAARPLRLHGQDARPRRRGRRAARPARRDDGHPRGQGLAARPQDRGQRGRPRPRRRHPRLPRLAGAAPTGRTADRRHVDPRPARRTQSGYRASGPRGPRRHRVPDAAAAEHALHPRHHLLDLRRRSRSIRCTGRPATTRRC